MRFTTTVLTSLLLTSSTLAYSFADDSWTKLLASGSPSAAITDYSSSFGIAVVPITTGTWTAKASAGAAELEAQSIQANGGNKAQPTGQVQDDEVSQGSAVQGQSAGASGTALAALAANTQLSDKDVSDGSDGSDGSAADTAADTAAGTAAGPVPTSTGSDDASDDSGLAQKREYLRRRQVTVLERRDDQTAAEDDATDTDVASTTGDSVATNTALNGNTVITSAADTDFSGSLSSDSADVTGTSAAAADSSSASSSAAAAQTDSSDPVNKSVTGGGSDPINTVSCAVTGALSMTLKQGILEDSKGRIGAIVSNRQFQFDGPPQAGTIYANGWSITPEGYLAIGTTEVFYRCLSGGFYNLYDENVAYQCSPIRLLATGIKQC